jgi:16S rRNA (guanine527-N7)-methyltransferase
MNMLETTTSAWGIPLDATKLEQFATYASELRRWNERVNLTAITDDQQVMARHFLDSLRCALSWGDAPGSLIDVGTGAGFPGLPLKILRPELRLTLVESIAKKAAFLQHIVDTLGLAEIEVVVARAEQVGRDKAHRERYDVVTARAVAELRVLAEYCLPLCRIGGRFLAPKGAQLSAEAQASTRAIELLGGRLLAIEPVEIPGLEPRSLVVVEKASATSPEYPRALGVPAKRPL